MLRHRNTRISSGELPNTVTYESMHQVREHPEHTDSSTEHRRDYVFILPLLENISTLLLEFRTYELTLRIPC